jgi:DNA-binding phage protein
MDEKTMREFDALVFPALDGSTWQRMAQKLTVAMEDRNPRVFLTALGTVIHTIGLELAAQRLGLTPARLSRIVGPKAKPSFEEVRGVVSGLGFRWGVAQRTTEKVKLPRLRSPRSAVDPRAGGRLRSDEAARRLASFVGRDSQSKPIPRRRSLISVLATMPNVGADSDFARHRPRKVLRKRR